MQDRQTLSKGFILVVEDSALIALDTAEMLQQCGYTVLGPASTLESARMVAAHAGRIDAAILDIGLGDESVFPLARELADQGVPILFVTGQSKLTAVPEEFALMPLLEKPVHDRELVSVICRLASPDGAGKTAASAKLEQVVPHDFINLVCSVN